MVRFLVRLLLGTVLLSVGFALIPHYPLANVQGVLALVLVLAGAWLLCRAFIDVVWGWTEPRR